LRKDLCGGDAHQKDWNRKETERGGPGHTPLDQKRNRLCAERAACHDHRGIKSGHTRNTCREPFLDQTGDSGLHDGDTRAAQSCREDQQTAVRCKDTPYLSAQEARLAHASRVNTLGEMASGIAHELTQPLTAILSQAQAARHLARLGDIAAVEPAVQGIAEQAKRASAILERLRNWTVPAQDAGRIGALGMALQNVELLLRPEATLRGVALRFDAVPPAIAIRGDQVELEQIIFNLAHNAIEAASGQLGGSVSVLARRLGDEVVVDVSDNGPGVAPDLRDRLFEPFVTGKPGGTGLGLALCQRLAERMGGEVLLVSAHPAVFRLRLPILRVPDGGAAA
jgi:C4-dicarboxylate-specific signal transduction histidine kinase